MHAISVLESTSSSTPTNNVFVTPSVESISRVHPTVGKLRNIRYSFDKKMNVKFFSNAIMSLSGSVSAVRMVEDNNLFPATQILRDVQKTSISEGFGRIDQNVIKYSKETIESITNGGLDLLNIYPLDEGGISIEVVGESGYLYTFSYYNDQWGTFTKMKNDEIPQGWDLNFKDLLDRTSTLF